MSSGYYVGGVWVELAADAWDVARRFARQRARVGSAADVPIVRERDGMTRIVRGYLDTRGIARTFTLEAD